MAVEIVLAIGVVLVAEWLFVRATGALQVPVPPQAPAVMAAQLWLLNHALLVIAMMLGAILAMIGGFELFRGLDQFRMLVFGGVMVLLMIWRPRGLVGHRAPTVFLQKRTEISSSLVKEGHG